ncbi:MAG: TonB-dependent receptor [Flavobacteriaceae bacterium]|nr:TonB-dependent receptor [Flavobacteriaceae bacterium]
MRKYFIAILLIISGLANSQNCKYSLSGKVTDLHDGSLLSGATLVFNEINKTAQTDLDGRYNISNLCKGQYSIKLIHPLCESTTFKININGNTNRDFKLEHHIEELNEIIVKGNSYDDQSKSVYENKVSTETLEQYSTGSLGDALNSLSGISSLNKGNGIVKPIINGLHSSRIIMINNGVRMQDQEWGKEHAPNIDINAIERLTVIKNASALQYGGDAMGGIIIAEGFKIPVKDTIYGKTMISAGSNGRGGGITSKLTKSYKNGIYGTLQGTMKRFGDVEAADYVMSNTGLYEKDMSLRMGLNRFNYGIEGYYAYFNAELGILRSSHAHSAGDQIRSINSNIPLVVRDFTYDINYPKQDVTHQLARIKGFKKFIGYGKLNFQYDFQNNRRFEYDIRVGNDRDKPALDLELKTHTILVDYITDYEFLNFKTGIMGRFQDNFANPDTGVRRLIPDYEKYDLGIYSVADYKLNENWQFEAGVRFDYIYMDAYKFYKKTLWEQRGYDILFPDLVVDEFGFQVLTNPELEFNNFSGTIGLTHKLSDKSKFFLNHAIASRAPNPSELFSEGLHHAIARIEIGDLRFKSEVGHKTSLTYEYLGKNLNFSINPFINNIEDFILIEPVELVETIRGNFPSWEYRQTNAQLFGVDVDASLKINDLLSLNHQLSIVKGYDKDRDLPLINMPPISTKNEISYNNKNLNNLKINLESEFVFAQNEYPDNNFEIFLPFTQTTELLDVSTPPDAYHLINLNSSIDFKVTENSSLTVGLRVTNLFNTSYRNYLNLLRFYSDDLGRNFLLNLKFNY